jgi:protein-S-isoprenylcysteine O-methyltransferase Ste14
MKITGAGPKIAVPTLVYLIITIVIDNLYYPIFKISSSGITLLMTGGIIITFIGVVFIVSAAVKLKRSFGAGILMQDGLYRVFRNPIYAGYLIFVIPGISFILNSWLVLSTVIINFILLEILIKTEYKYLEEKFGHEYKAYLEKVWIKFL